MSSEKLEAMAGRRREGQGDYLGRYVGEDAKRERGSRIMDHMNHESRIMGVRGGGVHLRESRKRLDLVGRWPKYQSSVEGSSAGVGHTISRFNLCWVGGVEEA